MAGIFHSHSQKRLHSSFGKTGCKTSDFAFCANYTIVRLFTTAPLQRVLIFNQICIGEYKPSPMGHHHVVTEPFFEISSSNCILGISFGIWQL